MKSLYYKLFQAELLSYTKFIPKPLSQTDKLALNSYFAVRFYFAFKSTLFK